MCDVRRRKGLKKLNFVDSENCLPPYLQSVSYPCRKVSVFSMNMLAT